MSEATVIRLAGTAARIAVRMLSIENSAAGEASASGSPSSPASRAYGAGVTFAYAV